MYIAIDVGKYGRVGAVRPLEESRKVTSGREFLQVRPGRHSNRCLYRFDQMWEMRKSEAIID
jgi:hypothetical protein